jgi:pSer/pThr/pTyr-binding forkhead associated (FHA) protein
MHCGERLTGETATPTPAKPLLNGASGDQDGGWMRTQPTRVVSPSTQITRTTVHPAVSAPNASAPRTSARPVPATGPAARLILQPGGGRETAYEFTLDGRNVTIGRAPACTVSLPDDQLASRLHAMLHYETNHYAVTDLGSSNGTLVNGVRIRGATPLADGDRITVGQHVVLFTVTLSQASAVAPAAATPFAESAPTVEAAAPLAGAASDGTPAGAELAAPAAVTVEAPLADAPSAAASDDAPAAPAAEAQDPSAAMAPASATPTETSSDALLGEEATSASVLASADPRNRPLPRDAFFGGWRDADISNLPRPRPAAQAAQASPETSDVLAAWTESATEHTQHLRAMLAELAERVDQDLAALGAQSLASYGAAGDGGAALDALIRMAEQVASDPQHVNSLMTLAGQCQDIADTLRNQQKVIATLETMRDRLAELAQEEGW